MLKKLFITMIFCTMASQSYANILFSKTYIELDNGKRSDVLEVTNIANKKMRYKVDLVEYKQLPTGEYISLKKDENEMSAKNLIYVSPKSFILDNKNTQTIRIMRKHVNDKVFTNLADGEYRTHLLVRETEDLNPEYSVYQIEETAEKTAQENQESFSIEIKGFMGMSIPVIFRKGTLNVEAKIVSAKKIVNSNGQPVLKLEIDRTGNKSVRGNITILANNKEVGVFDNFAIYSENTKRIVEVPLDLKPLKGREINSIKVIYKKSGKNNKILSTYEI